MSKSTEKTIDVKMSIETAGVEKEVHAITSRMISERLLSMASQTVLDLFYDPNNPYKTRHAWQLTLEQQADLGYMRKVVKGALTEVALDPKWEEMAKKVYAAHIEGFVREAAVRKARHDANKIVFANRGERHKAEKQG